MYYFLSGGDLSKLDDIKRKPLLWIYSFLYLKRVKQLNELYGRLPRN
jgi:hypothetical protein